MEVVDQTTRRRSLKERLGFKGMTCCGSTWNIGPEDDGGPIVFIEIPQENVSDPGQSPAMNLATALAAERQFRASLDLSPSPPRPSSDDERGSGATLDTPSRVSLMRLLEETDSNDGEMKKEDDGVGCDSVCCVCMIRKKGAAFIPCGHTFCRVCSREVWLNRGSCPLCNRSIIEILDIY